MTHPYDDFWDHLVKEAAIGADVGGSIDSYLSGKPLEGEQFTSMRALTDKGRAARALMLPVKEGTRVEFVANLGTVMSYTDPPEPKAQGTVVSVRSATGDVTDHEGMVFAKWDDGKTRGIHAEHLRLVATPTRRKEGGHMRVASLGDLTDFLKVAESTLIHKSTHDLWTFRQDGSEYVIERLFDSSGEPLKG